MTFVAPQILLGPAVLLVTKRDGSKRFVVDYRILNNVTQTDSYPMPNRRDILDLLNGDVYFSTV